MTTVNYMLGRQKYARPQGMLFANNSGRPDQDVIVPDGTEFEDFIILSDDNREPISFSIDRIENRQRTVNGRMRSFHVADKLEISTSWSRLPSRSYASLPNFNNLGESQLDSGTGIRVPGDQGYSTIPKKFFTTDGGAGGAELLDWYNNNKGSFWVYLAYDNYKNFSEDGLNRLNHYSEVVEVFFSDFSYSVEKRGASNHDLWDVSLSLEEV